MTSFKIDTSDNLLLLFYLPLFFLELRRIKTETIYTNIPFKS